VSGHERCPCCATEASPAAACPACGHRWHVSPCSPATTRYASLCGRNALPTRYVERKLEERAAAIQPLIRPGLRILEIGCAEGLLGARLKQHTALDYWGVEPSLDAVTAQRVLDRVVRDSRDLLPCTDTGRFDLVLSFHVLEHIPDVADELRRWRSVIQPDGSMMVEVPYQAGHPDVGRDLNPEHVHHFTFASLSCLLERSGFELVTLGRGYFESPFYADSLRAIAHPAATVIEREKRLLARFKKNIPHPFAVLGLGGDFRNYVYPILGSLPVQALLDNDPGRTGESLAGRLIEPYDATRHRTLPILVASLRHEDDILTSLTAAGHPPEGIHLLSMIFADGDST